MLWIWIRVQGDLLDPDSYGGQCGSRIGSTTNADPHHCIYSYDATAK